jgi:Flp pilus assembly protein TadB
VNVGAVMTALWVVVLLSASLWSFGRGLDRSPRSIAAARRQLHGVTEPTGISSVDRCGRAIAESPLGARVVTVAASDLAVLDISASTFAGRVVASAAGAAFVGLGGVASVMAMGLLPVSVVWMAVPLLLAASAVVVCRQDVRSKAQRTRRAVRRATHDLVQLVAVALTTDVSVEEAVRFALDFGDGEQRMAMRQAALTAPQRGVALWDALHDFGVRYDCLELRDFAVALERQSVEGVSIGQTVTSMATALRSAALDELEREADRANANLSGPTVGFVMATVVFLAYPLAQRINDAFGG